MSTHFRSSHERIKKAYAFSGGQSIKQMLKIDESSLNSFDQTCSFFLSLNVYPEPSNGFYESQKTNKHANKHEETDTDDH